MRFRPGHAESPPAAGESGRRWSHAAAPDARREDRQPGAKRRAAVDAAGSDRSADRLR